MEKVCVSIVIPVYNVKDYLVRCLDSVKEQTLKEIEVILIDDGSSDGSEKICDQYAREDSRFCVVHQINAGSAAARNRGLEMAQGKYVAFPDSDDWLEADAYEKLYSLLEEEKGDVAFGIIEREFQDDLCH